MCVANVCVSVGRTIVGASEELVLNVLNLTCRSRRKGHEAVSNFSCSGQPRWSSGRLTVLVLFARVLSFASQSWSHRSAVLQRTRALAPLKDVEKIAVEQTTLGTQVALV